MHHGYRGTAHSGAHRQEGVADRQGQGRRLFADSWAFTGQRIDTLSFDGTTLHTVTGDRRQVLDLAPDRLAATVCRRVGRDITAQEWHTYVPDAPYRSLC